jgi:hypothetical protein
MIWRAHEQIYIISGMWDLGYPGHRPWNRL